MKIIDFFIPLIFIVIILKQLRYIQKLLIPATKTYLEIIIVCIGVFVFMYIIYFYANTWFHYITGVLGIIMFISPWLKKGITSKGFTSMYKYKEVILWSEIEKVIVISSKNIKIKLLGNFMEQTFYFKNGDYHKVISIIKENLPKQAKLEIK